MDLEFRSTDSWEHLAESFKLSAPKPLNANEYSEHMIAASKEFVLQSLKRKIEAFQLLDKGKVVASAIVRRAPAFYRAGGLGSAINTAPDPFSIGVHPVTALYLSFIYVQEEYRGDKLSESLISKTIELVESLLIEEKISASNREKNDSFVNMVTTDGRVDRSLANYYLSKQYFWVLYLSIGDYYTRFGFRAYPLDEYKVPLSMLTDQDSELIEMLMEQKSGLELAQVMGKKLRLIRYSNPADRDTIAMILQSKELEIATEMNQLVFNTELSSGHKSSSSLTNLRSTLSMSRMGLNPIGSITELSSLGNTGVIPRPREPSEAQQTSEVQPPLNSGTRRGSAAMVEHNLPKFAIKPDSHLVQKNLHIENAIQHSRGADDIADIKGCIFTNEMQGKSYYILWHTAIRTYVIGMGELKMDPVGYGGAGFGAATTGMPGGRRRSSSALVNELGGVNFQDLNLLIQTACYVVKRSHELHLNSLYFAVNDLPDFVPAPVLHDYFLNYLPLTFEHVKGENEADEEAKVKFITGLSLDELRVLPMLRVFGQDNAEKVNIDWIANGMYLLG